jgi:hypothetical protein
MSENTVNGGLRRLDWSGSEMSGHGFRSMASTLDDEKRFRWRVREPVGTGLSRIERVAEWAACGRRGTLAWRPVNGRGPSAKAYWRPDFPGKARGP